MVVAEEAPAGSITREQSVDIKRRPSILMSPEC